MRICDRCRMPDPTHVNYFMLDKTRDLCEFCFKDYQELQEVFNEMERTFLKGKNLKHIDFQWEDIRK